MHNTDREAIKGLAEEFGINSDVLLKAYKTLGLSIEDLEDSLTNLDLTEGMSNVGSANMDIDFADSNAQSNRSMAQAADSFGAIDNKTAGSAVYAKKQFGEYMEFWLTNMRERLNISPYDDEALYTAFLSETDLSEHLNTDDIRLLSSKDEQGNYLAAPNDHLMEYLALEAFNSPDSRGKVHRNFFVHSAQAAQEDCDTIISLSPKVEARNPVPLESLIIKATIRNHMRKKDITVLEVANKVTRTHQSVSQHLSPYHDILPQADDELMAMAGREEEVKQRFDKLTHNHYYPQGITSLQELSACIRDKKGQNYRGKNGLDKKLGVTRIANKLDGEKLFSTRDLVLLKSWLSEHVADGQYEHLGINTALLESMETAKGVKLSDIPIISAERNEADVVEACYKVDIGDNPDAYNVVKFLLLEKKGTLNALNIKLETATLTQQLKSQTSDKTTKKVVNWIENILRDENGEARPKYAKISEFLPSEALYDLIQAPCKVESRVPADATRISHREPQQIYANAF